MCADFLVFFQFHNETNLMIRSSCCRSLSSISRSLFSYSRASGSFFSTRSAASFFSCSSKICAASVSRTLSLRSAFSDAGRWSASPLSVAFSSSA